MFYSGILFLSHIVCYDIWFYVSHLILHLPWFYRNIHHIHHEKQTHLIFLDAYYGHFFESVFQSIGFLVPLMFFTEFHWIPFLIALGYVNVKGMMRHDSRLVDSFSFVKHHLRHHTNPRINYGEEWLDYLFGTYSA